MHADGRGGGEPRRQGRAKHRHPDGAHLHQLMEEIRDGSASSLQEFMDHLWPDLVRFAAWELGDQDAARDVAQEAFIYLWQHRHTWVRQGSPKAYLYRIARHQILDQQRHRRVRAAWASRQASWPPAGPPDPAEMLAADRLQATFDEALASLPARRREAFHLVVMRGFSHQEAAEVLDISEQTVANQVSAALRDLRRALRAVSDLIP